MLDKLERKLIQLKIEREAVKDKDGFNPSARCFGQGIKQFDKEYSYLEEVWTAEKASVQGISKIKSVIEQVKQELDVARRAGELTLMSEIR